MRLLLLLKRSLVFLLGVGLVWLTIFTFFPWFDKRLPLALALLATYCVIAYIGLPALARLWRILQKPTHVPTRSLEADGWAADPINIVMLTKNKKELVAAMQGAGWLPADPPKLKNVLRALLATTLNRPYPTAPFEPNYVFGKQQDLSFQIPVGNSPLQRHRVRFWQLSTTLLANEHEHLSFWRRLLARFLHKKKQIWIGAAVFNKGINAKRRNLQFGHGVEGNTVIERDYLVETLRKAGALKEVTALKAGEPLHTKYHRFGEVLRTDGYVKLCELRRPQPQARAKKRLTSSYELQSEAQAFVQDLIHEIDRANTIIAAQFYTFEADAAGLPVAQALLRAQKRGVRVRFMVDQSINFTHNSYYIHKPRLNRQLQASIMKEWRATQQLLDTMQRAGIDIKLLNPLGLLQRNILRRDHKKLVVIDPDDPRGGICYMGGVNLSDHNVSWNDFMVKMRGSMTYVISDELEDTWYGTSTSGTKTFDDGQLITDVRRQSLIIPAAVRLIRQAKSRVILESPFPWGKHIIGALIESAERGVDVSVIIPQHISESFFVPTNRSVKRMVQRGVHVYRFQKNRGKTHAKALLADDTALFGSSNFNEFLAGNLAEACLLTSNTSLTAQLEKLLTSDMMKSAEAH